MRPYNLLPLPVLTVDFGKDYQHVEILLCFTNSKLTLIRNSRSLIRYTFEIFTAYYLKKFVWVSRPLMDGLLLSPRNKFTKHYFRVNSKRFISVGNDTVNGLCGRNVLTTVRARYFDARAGSNSIKYYIGST